MTRSRSDSYSDAVSAGLWAVALLALLWASPAGAETVTASWYGKAHHGRLTASGARFDMHGLSAAHRTMKFGTRLRVCRSGCVVVIIQDRGPFVAGRSLDLSAAAARAIGLDRAGVGRVSVERVK